MKLLVTGPNGLLGPFLLEEFAPLGEVVLCPRSMCDLRDASATADFVAAVQPDVVVHAAAYTDVDGCERDPNRAMLDNFEATRNLASACPANTQLLMTSTDQVYSDTPGPHTEDGVGPVNVYGTTKLMAEAAVLAHPRGLVVRCNFFATSRTAGRWSLSDVIAQCLRDEQTFTGFTDSVFSPLHATTLATHMAACIGDGLSGVFNLTSTEGISKAAFARLVARRLGLNDQLVVDTTTSTLPDRAPRPRDLRMDPRRYLNTTGRTLPTLVHEVELL
jgi:dTDP-4-dehydrorhamnose reductase